MEDIKLWENGTPGYSKDLGPEPTLTPYVLENGKKNGCIIVCPGGAYFGRAPHEAYPIAERMNEFGMSAFILNYRVNPYHYPYITADVIRAIRFVRYNAEKFNIDPERIGILGFSAGGHLAMSSAIVWTDPDILPDHTPDEIDKASARPDFQVLCYPVVTFIKDTHSMTRDLLTGDLEEKEQFYKRMSGEQNVISLTPPAFIWTTANDSAVPASNSIDYASALIRAGVPCELHVFPEGNHGLGLGEKDERYGIMVENESVKQWSPLLKTFLEKYGYSK